MKKLFSLLMLVVMTMLVFGVVAHAEGEVVTYYEVSTFSQLETALTAAKTVTDDTVTIKLTNNITDTTSSVTTTTAYDPFVKGEKVVIDLNEKTISMRRRLYIKGDVTIKNGDYNFLNTKSDYYAIYFTGTDSANRTKLTMNGVNLTATSGSGSKGITMDGSGKYGDLVLEDTNIKSSGIVLYTAGDKTNNTMLIKSGNFITNNDDGYVVKFQNCKSIRVDGGTFKNIKKVPTSYNMFNAARDGVTRIQYYGGTFPVDISTAAVDSLPKNYYCLKTGVNEYTVEDSKGAAKIVGFATGGSYYDGTHFETLALAVNDAKEGQAITLLANNTEAVEINKPVTITKNGFTANNVTAGEGYVLKATDTAYIVEEAPSEVTVAEKITETYDDGKGTKTARFFADINTLDVAEAGFEVSATFGGVKYTWEIALSEVYSTVVANDVTYNATNYILTGALGDVPADFEDEFEVKVYTKNYEGIKSYR